MFDDPLDGMVCLDQALDQYDQLSQKLGIPVTFKTRSQWRRHSRQESDALALDRISKCEVDLYQALGAICADLHIAVELPSTNLKWIFMKTEAALRLGQARCASDLHLEVLPTRGGNGYLLRLSKRLYPPRTFVGGKIGELGHAFMRVSRESFKEMRQSGGRNLNCPQAFVNCVRNVGEIALHLNGELFFVTGVFRNGKLTKSRFPRQTLLENL